MWKDSNYLTVKLRPFLALCVQHGHTARVAPEIEKLPEIATSRLMVTTEQLEAIRIAQEATKPKKRVIEDHHLPVEEYGAEDYATIPMPTVHMQVAPRPDPDTDKQPIVRSMMFKWESMWGYRDIAIMLYQARRDYFKRYSVYPQTMTISRWNWTNAWIRDLRDYPLRIGRVERDEVLCEG